MNSVTERLSEFSRELSWQLKTLLQYSPRLTRKPVVGDLARVCDQAKPEFTERFQVLTQQYAMSDWGHLCNRIEALENLMLLDVMDQLLDPIETAPVGLDVGCRNFSYLPALSAFTGGPWHGVELDAHVRYLNGKTRRAYGEWMAGQRKGCEYISASLLDVQQQYGVIVWVLPFVRPLPLQRWGLPARFFQPLELLQKAFAVLEEGGLMFIVNQGEQETAQQQALFELAGINATFLGEITSVFSPFSLQRFGWCVTKPG